MGRRTFDSGDIHVHITLFSSPMNSRSPTAQNAAIGGLKYVPTFVPSYHDVDQSST